MSSTAGLIGGQAADHFAVKWTGFLLAQFTVGASEQVLSAACQLFFLGLAPLPSGHKQPMDFRVDRQDQRHYGNLRHGSHRNAGFPDGGLPRDCDRCARQKRSR